MSSKLFDEGDQWGDSSGASGSQSFSFKKVQKSKTQIRKEKKAKKRNHSDLEDDPNAGKYVRAPKYYGLEDSSGGEVAAQESPAKTKKNKRKRKHEDVQTNGHSTDGMTPEKKVKKSHHQPVPDVPTTSADSYEEKLRESLKGSRFRFLNEQMYKQTGKESMKVFQEDETAFDAYHEGYRHQVQNWPMNPLDRIINNLKRL